MAQVTFAGGLSFVSPDQQCQRTEGNTKHWPQPVTWPHPFFIHHQTPDARGVAAFLPALWCKYHNAGIPVNCCVGMLMYIYWSPEEILRWTTHELWRNTVVLQLIRLAAFLCPLSTADCHTWWQLQSHLVTVPRVGPGHPFPPCPSLPHLLLFFTFPLFPFLICFTYFLLLSIPSPFLPE